MKVLILAEDFVKDEFLLQPIIQAMMKSVGKPKAKVKVCRDPRFHGTGEALKWEYVEQALRRHRGMVDLFLLCVDRDGNAHRHVVLGNLENEAKAVIGEGRAFLAENAWQEVEVWVLMGHELLPITPARKFRMLLHINPTRQRGKRTGSLARASGWYMTFFAAGVITNKIRLVKACQLSTPTTLEKTSNGTIPYRCAEQDSLNLSGTCCCGQIRGRLRDQDQSWTYTDNRQSHFPAWRLTRSPNKRSA